MSADNTARRIYDDLASTYDRRWQPYLDATLRAVLEVVDLAGNESVLDVACGTGELERRLLAQWPGLSICGADLSLGMLRRASAKEPAARVTWIEANAASLPLADQAFDWVICANSFHYFRSPESALREIRRVLRPGGRLALVDWCDDYLTCKLCSLWLRWTDPAFYRTYSLRACRELVARAGFQIDEAQRFRINWLWGLMRLVCRRAVK